MKENFSEERWKEICEEIKKFGININSSFFTRSEIKLIISETVLSPDDELLAKIKYVDGISDVNTICERLGYSREDYNYHRAKTSLLLRKTCNRIFK